MVSGDYVENVDPRYPLGVVLGVEADYPTEPHVSVKTGRGSHVWGPAKWWRVTDQRPEWLDACS